MSSHCCLMSGTVWIDEGLLKSMILHVCLSTIWLFSFGSPPPKKKVTKENSKIQLHSSKQIDLHSTFCITRICKLSNSIVSFRFGQWMLNGKSDTSTHLHMRGLCNALVLQILQHAEFPTTLMVKTRHLVFYCHRNIHRPNRKLCII